MYDAEPTWGSAGRNVFERTYSRKKANGEPETWFDTVTRVVNGNLGLVDTKYHEPHERERLFELFYTFKALPAGRHLWMSGVPGRQFLFNCHHAGWDRDDITSHFTFTFDQLMQGGGVGANYSNYNLASYGIVRTPVRLQIVCSPEHADYAELVSHDLLSDTYSSEWTGGFVVDDTREGWYAALADLINGFYFGDGEPFDLVFDLSNIRHRGARIKTFGGTAAGPAPLAILLRNVADLLTKKIGEQLQTLDAMAIDHYIADCVVSGNVRRSARMAIKNWAEPDVFDFIHCKDDHASHWTTNISVEIDKPFFQALAAGDPQAKRVLRETTAAMLANGEPGFYNRALAQQGEVGQVESTNPCVTGDTVIATVDGPRTFADLAESGADVLVYAWHPNTKVPVIRWMRRPHKTRAAAEVLAVTFDSGLVVRCTPDHNFYSFRGQKVAAKDLRIGQSIRAFSASRDSSRHERIHGWDGHRNAAAHQWTHRMIWEAHYGQIPDGMVIAHLDNDGTNNDLDNLALMTDLAHRRYDMPMRQAAGMDGHCPNHKVVSIDAAGFEDVYNGCVDDAHTYIILDQDPIAGHMSGIVSANCGEIALEQWENCNLGHVNLDSFVGNDAAALEAHRLMTRYLVRATFGDVPNSRQREVLDRNRRIGVGHFGFQGWIVKQGVRYSDSYRNADVRRKLRSFYDAVRSEAHDYAFQLRIPEPIKVTTVAPTGTIAKMPGKSEGIHPIYAKYFIRRVRYSTVDPDQIEAVSRLAAEGHHVEPDLYSRNTAVVEFLTKDSLMQEVEELGFNADFLVESADEISLNDMLGVQALYQAEYADNAVSFTVNIPPDQEQQAHFDAQVANGIAMAEFGPASDGMLQKVVDMLHRWLPYLKGTTLMIDGSRPQAPYQRISKAEYELAQYVKSVDDSYDSECASGACPIK